METISKKKWTVLAQVGIISRGIIFTIMGVLTSLSVLQKAPEKKADSVAALYFIEQTTFGSILLSLLAVGVLIYIIWRIKLTLNVSESESKFERIRLISNHIGIAFIYLFFLFIIVKILLGLGGSSGDTYDYIKEYLSELWAKILIAIVGLGVIGKGLYQFYLAYHKMFLKLVDENRFSENFKKVFVVFGRIGYVARGLVFSVLGFLIFRASYSLYANPNKDVKDALNFISKEFGEMVLLGVGVGLIIFSLFVFIKAKYRIIDVTG